MDAIRECYEAGPDLAGGGQAPSSLEVTKWETKVTHTHITNEKNMKGLVGSPLLVGGLGPGPLGTP